MHDASMELMRDFVETYGLQDANVIDMGSKDINGTYRNLFPGGRYTGADIFGGKNVDVIIGSAEWDALEQADAVISGQTLEHVGDIPAFFDAIREKLKPGGLVCLIAPSAGPAHQYPIWVGHFPEERMREVVEEAGFEIVECIQTDGYPFHDTRCIARVAK